MKLTFPVIAAVALFVSISGCDQTLDEQRKGDLNRALAEEILNKTLPNISQLKFNKGGIDRAEDEGIIRKQDSFPPYYEFTEKGLDMVGGYIAENRIRLTVMGVDSPKFELKEELGQRVAEVTGIADGANPSSKIVEYTTDYVFPDAMAPMRNYLFVGSETSSRFQKYDDGWRIDE